MAKPVIPNIPGMEYTDGYEDMSLNRDDFEGQTVLILGELIKNILSKSGITLPGCLHGFGNIVFFMLQRQFTELTSFCPGRYSIDLANNVDPDQMPHLDAQGLICVA